nr:glutamate mutase [Streptomyces spiroverticillatus]
MNDQSGPVALGAPVAAREDAAPQRRRRTVVVSGVASDSHTWNLVFLQLLIEELGCDVINLGPCVPDELLVRECLEHSPDLLVLSSVNGHGAQDGLRMIRKLRARTELAGLPAVIGGKLGVSGGEGAERVAELIAAGFDSVFQDGSQEVSAFRRFLTDVPQRALS